MSDTTYKMIEIVGTSKESVAKAINNGIERASKTLHGLSWFQVSEIRGGIEKGKVDTYQVIMKVGLKLD